MKLRVFYEGKGRWGIDMGYGTIPLYVRYVVIDGKLGMTHTNPSADNITEPRAWFEFIEGRIDIQGDTARIY